MAQVNGKQEIAFAPDDERRELDRGDLWTKITDEHLLHALPPDTWAWSEDIAQHIEGIAATSWLKHGAGRARDQSW